MGISIKKKRNFFSAAVVITTLSFVYYLAFCYAISLNDNAVLIVGTKQWNDKEAIEEAIEDINLAIKICPWNSTFYLNKIIFTSRIKDYTNLLKTNSKLIKLHPNSAYYKTQRGLFYDLLGDSTIANILYSKALNTYKKNIETIHQENYQYHLEYITCLILSGKKEEAKAVLDKLKIDYPDDKLLENYPINTKKEILQLSEKSSI